MENNKTTKVCADCGRELPIEEFPKNFRSKDGHLTICRECKGKRVKAANKAKEDELIKKIFPNAEQGNAETKTEMKSTHLSKLTDKELVGELRSRGWDVKCTKTIEL